MITQSNIERQFGIPVAPHDSKLRFSIYLKFAGLTQTEIRSAIERDLRNQIRSLLETDQGEKNRHLIESVFSKLRSRLAMVSFPENMEGLVAFADSKQILIHYLKRVTESRVIASQTFNIRPLLGISELYSRYIVVTLHGGHTAGYMRQGQDLKKLFSFTAEMRPSQPGGAEDQSSKVRRKKQRSRETMDFAIEQLEKAGDLALCVFGPKYLRSKFRRLLTKHKLRHPMYEADAEVPLDELVKRADLWIGVAPENAAVNFRERIRSAEKAGLVTSDMDTIAIAAEIGAIETFVVTSQRYYWVDPTAFGSTRTLATRTMNFGDDCILDDISERVLASGGQVADLPLMKSNGYPAFAILRWHPGTGKRVVAKW